jgi:nitroimidazol reductase NimA-like FMN-containing flavoprotein (pyridoxamine 5'-phosphate oxidase superfamily)
VKHVPLERRDDFLVTMYDVDDDACRQLLLRCRFRRVAFVDPVDGPTVLPVNCLFSDGSVLLLQAAADSALARVCDGRLVAFEADDSDPVTESGWSVLGRGTASHLTDGARIVALAESDVHPCAPFTARSLDRDPPGADHRAAHLAQPSMATDEQLPSRLPS